MGHGCGRLSHPGTARSEWKRTKTGFFGFSEISDKTRRIFGKIGNCLYLHELIRLLRATPFVCKQLRTSPSGRQDFPEVPI